MKTESSRIFRNAVACTLILSGLPVPFIAAPDSENAGHSIRASVTWPDGTIERLVVFKQAGGEEYSTIHSNYSSLGGPALTLAVSGERTEIPWLGVRSIKSVRKKLDGRIEVAVTTTSGELVVGAAEDPLRIEGYWEGLPVTAKSWSSISNFERMAYVTPPDWGSSSCSGAGGCTGSPPDWGIWTFRTHGDKAYTGLLTGGFGVDRSNTEARDRDNRRIPVGLFPTDVLFSTHQGGVYDTGRFEVEVSPSYTVKKIDFSNVSKGRVSLELINGRTGSLELQQQQVVDLRSNGFLIWSKLGQHQVRCLIRIKDLQSMELVKVEGYSNLKGHVNDIDPIKIYWEIERGDSARIRAIAIHGHQKQLVPTKPPPGKYWTVRPPKEPGEVAGDFVVTSNDAGYCLIPLGIVAEFMPKQRQLRMRNDAGGQNLPFSRFHLGYDWISNGSSGQEYIDEDAETNLNISNMWLSYEAYGKTESVALDQIRTIKQIQVDDSL